MKWKSHIAIVKAISDRLNINSKSFIEGVILPDKDREMVLINNKYYYASHHRYPTRKIFKHILNARSAYNKHNYKEAYTMLGVALHYIHDRLTSRYKGIIFKHDNHDIIEEDIASLPADYEAIDKGIEDSISDPIKVRKIIDSKNSSNKANKVMSNACYISAYIVKAVLSNDNRTLRKYSHYKQETIALPILAFLSIYAYYHGVKPFIPNFEYNMIINNIPLLLGFGLIIASIDRIKKFILYRKWIK